MFLIREITEQEYPDIQNLIHATVTACYPAIFEPEVVQFFIQYHSLEEIRRRATSGVVVALTAEDGIKATGFLAGEEMGGVYVHPQFQQQGFGTAVVNYLLGIANKNKLGRVWLDATSLAKPMYDKLGFEVVSPMIQWVGKVPLPYLKIEKKLTRS